MRSRLAPCGPGSPRLPRGMLRAFGVVLLLGATTARAQDIHIPPSLLLPNYDRVYPGFGFASHKGYATQEHLDALGRLGPCEIHRRSFYAVGVFFQKDLFADSWGAMAQTLRVRSYRMYCSAKKLAAAPGLTLAEFRTEERRLRRDYADVLACAEASPHADLMEEVLSAARAELASPRRQKRPE